MTAIVAGTADRYLPSVVAHTWPVHYTAPTLEKLPTLKSKRASDRIAPITRPKRDRKLVQIDLDDGVYSTSPASRQNQAPLPQTYQQQLDNLSRSIPGLHVGAEVKLLQPGKVGAKRKSKLAVFKFSSSQSLFNLQFQTGPTGSAAPNRESTVTGLLSETGQPAAETVYERTSPHAPPEPVSALTTVDQRAGSKRKRSVHDDARRDKVPPRPPLTSARNPPAPVHEDAYTVIGFESSRAQCQTTTEIGSADDLQRRGGLQSPVQVVGPEGTQQQSSSRPQPSEGVITPSGLDDDPVESTLSNASETIQHAAPDLASAHKGNETAKLHSPTPSVRDVEFASAEIQLPQTVEKASPATKGRQKQGIKKLQPHGGSIAAQRRKIFMDIVERCGGIYPGITELALPYQDEWIKLGHSGKIERQTLRTLAKDLCNSGQLRQVTFCFQDKAGVVVTKTLITKVEISTTDPRVSQMQKAIKEAYPDSYTPKEVTVLDDSSKGLIKARYLTDLNVDEERVHLMEVPAYIGKWERLEAYRKNRQAQEAREAVIYRAIAANNGILPPGMEVQSESILGPLHLPYAQRRLLALAKKSTPNVPRRRKVDRLGNRDKAPAGRETFRNKNSTSWLLNVSKSLHELKRKRAQRDGRPLDFSRVLTIDGFEKDLASQILEEDLSQEKDDMTTAEIAQDDTPRPRLPAYARPLGVRKVRNADRHSWEARQQMYTIMEPEHSFHPATGTYSVNFSRFRTTNQILRKYHWQRPAGRSFHDHVDDSRAFELNAKGFEDARFSNWPFVNYTFPHRQTVPLRQTAYKKGSWYSKPDDSWDYQQGSDPTGARRSGMASTGVLARRRAQTSAVSTKRKQSASLEPFKTRQLTTIDKISRRARPRASDHSLENPEISDKQGVKQTRKREPNLTPEESRRILTAVIVVRTMTGGVERLIDWVLVAKALEPAYEQEWIQSKWPRILQSYKVQAQQVEANFHALFLRAYEDGMVPPIDYDDLQGYDWAWLIDWIIDNLDMPLDATLDLPLQRDELNELFDLSTGEDPNLSGFFEFDTGSTKKKREAELHQRALVRSLDTKLLETSKASNEEVEVAKTWIRANVATKAESYKPQFAWDKLSRFDGIIPRLVDEMVGDRVLMQENKGRLKPGRNYDLNEQYLKPLRKKIEASCFNRASMFKRQIDEVLAERGEMILPEMAEDAFMMATQNMQAHRRVSLVAKNPPMKKWGLGEDGTYKTRLIDKKKLLFDVGMQATESYVAGNPLLPLPRPPSEPVEAPGMSMIPLWYDINGDLIPELWQLSVAATMSILAMRPGICVQEVETSVRPTLGVWEVQLLLDWMVQARAARKTGNGYITEEWWWLCLDSGKTLGEDAERVGGVQLFQIDRET